VIIKVRSQSPPGLIIKGLDNQARKSLISPDDQGFRHVSPVVFGVLGLGRTLTYLSDRNLVPVPNSTEGISGSSGIFPFQFITTDKAKTRRGGGKVSVS
jgi:hypothetical protein